MNYYEVPLAWTRLILDGFSPLTLQGKSNAFSLLFPMEAVFESYVASILNKHPLEGLSLKIQASSKYLVKHKSKRRFQLKPDLLLRYTNGINKGKSACVLDTKWKLINQKDEDNKYGLSQADFYQMFAYGHKYLKGKGELFLIYPSHDEFQTPIEQSFDFDDESVLSLWIVPFDTSVDMPDDKRFSWPKNCALQQVKALEVFAKCS